MLLVLIDVSLRSSRMILYNPLSCASKMMLEMEAPVFDYEPYVFGFGYGATSNDLKGYQMIIDLLVMYLILKLVRGVDLTTSDESLTFGIMWVPSLMEFCIGFLLY